jgi:NADH dehydrogenase (ubiquinone) 1 beta subcomplex subunit 7
MGGGDHHHSPAAMPVEKQDLDLLRKHQVPLAYRDTCAHLLVDLNICRRETYYNPGACQHQRHTYEECGYIAWLRRVEKKKELKAAEAAAAAAEAADTK